VAGGKNGKVWALLQFADGSWQRRELPTGAAATATVLTFWQPAAAGGPDTFFVGFNNGSIYRGIVDASGTQLPGGAPPPPITIAGGWGDVSVSGIAVDPADWHVLYVTICRFPTLDPVLRVGPNSPRTHTP